MPSPKKSLRLSINLIPVNGSHETQHTDFFEAMRILTPLINGGAIAGNTPVKVKHTLSDSESEECQFLAQWNIN